MAARSVKIRHDDQTRAKIKTSQLINRLTDHVLGTVEMTASQVRAAEILLSKTLPSLASVEHSGEVSHPTVVRAPPVAKGNAEWQQQHAPPRQTIQ
jgi:hypothetical protein